MTIYTCPYAAVDEAQWEANKTGRPVFIIDHGEYMTIEKRAQGSYLERVYPND